MLTSCSDSNPWTEKSDTSSEIPVSVTITAAPLTSQTRAEIVTSEPENNEKIHSWWMAFVADGDVKATISQTPSPTESDIYSGTELNLTPGRYTVYAFANIPQSEYNTNAEIIKLINGGIWTSLPQYGDNVPMTGKKEITIRESGNNSFSIEVIRLCAKVTLQYTCDVDGGMTVNGVSLINTNTTAINLFPEYAKVSLTQKNSELFGNPVNLPASVDKYNRQAIYDGYPLSINKIDSDKSIFVEKSFYIYESNAAEGPTKHETGSYLLEFDLGNGKKRTALLHEFHHINRNDHLRIPIKFTEWDITLKAAGQPPIGGYPPEFDANHEDEFYATFSTSGKFAIAAIVKDRNGNEILSDKLILPEKPSSTYSLSANIDNANNEILNDNLKVEKTFGNEIVGEIKQNVTGKSIVNLTFNITLNGVEYNILKKLHIIRKPN